MNRLKFFLLAAALVLPVSSTQALEWVDYDGAVPENAVSVNEGTEDRPICRRNARIGVVNDSGKCRSVKIGGRVVNKTQNDGFQILYFLENSPPVPQSFSGSTLKDVEYSGILTATDEDEDSLSFAIESMPDYGTVTLDGSTGEFVYIPDSEYVGNATFTFSVNDGNEVAESTAVIAVYEDPYWHGTYMPGCNDSTGEWYGVAHPCRGGSFIKYTTYLRPNKAFFHPGNLNDEEPSYAYIGTKQYAFHIRTSRLFNACCLKWTVKIYERVDDSYDELIHEATYNMGGTESAKVYSLRIAIMSSDGIVTSENNLPISATDQFYAEIKYYKRTSTVSTLTTDTIALD